MSRSRWVALGVLCASLLAIVVDNTIVNVALPTLARDLGADVGALQWVVDAYTVVFAGLLLLAGALGDRFGRRRTLLAGLVVFGLGSTAAAAAGGAGTLIACRAVMGAGAAFVMPATLSLLVSVFPDERERGMAVGIWAATAGLGVALGPVVGGILLGGFVVRQRRIAEPLLDVGLFRNPRFSAASATVMVLFFALFGFLFLATQYLQLVLGLSPSAAGVRVLRYAGAMIVFAAGSAPLVARFGTKGVATLGMLLFAAGLAVAATVGTDTGYGRLAIAFVLMGAGMGLDGAPATESIMNALPPARANIGSAVNDTTRELGGALGVAVVGSIMSSLYAGALPDAVPDAARDSLGAAVAAGGTVADAARDAFVEAMARASIVVAAVAAVGALIAWRYLPSRAAAPVASAAEAATVRG